MFFIFYIQLIFFWVSSEPLAKKQEIRDRCCRLHHNILDREETGLYKGFIFCVA